MDLSIANPYEYMDKREKDIREKLRKAAPKVLVTGMPFHDAIVCHELGEWIKSGHSVSTFYITDLGITDIQATLWVIGHYPDVWAHHFMQDSPKYRFTLNGGEHADINEAEGYAKYEVTIDACTLWTVDFKGYGLHRSYEHSAALYVMLKRSGLFDDDDVILASGDKKYLARDKDTMFEIARYATGFDDPAFFDDILRSHPMSYALFFDLDRVDKMLEIIRNQPELKAVLLRFRHDMPNPFPKAEKMRL